MKPVNLFLADKNLKMSEQLLLNLLADKPFHLFSHPMDIEHAEVIVLPFSGRNRVDPRIAKTLGQIRFDVPVIGIEVNGNITEAWPVIPTDVQISSNSSAWILKKMIIQIVEIFRRKDMQNKLQQDFNIRANEIKSIIDMGILFTGTLSRIELYDLIISTVQRFIPASFGYFATIPSTLTIATIRSQFGLDESNRFFTPTRRLNKPFIDNLKTQPGPVCDLNPFANHRILRDEVISLERIVDSLLLSPVRSKDKLIGYIVVGNQLGGLGFTESDCERLEVIADFAAVALENAFLYEQTDLLAQIDDLTRLHNFNSGFEYVRQLIKEHDAFAMVFLDLDGFKKVNERFGHLRGNEALQKVSEIIRMKVRPEDLASRFGGDEFMIVMPGKDIEEAISMCRAIIDAIENEKVFKDYTLSGSTGIARFPEDGSEIGSIIQAADSAMYHAKSLGRGQIVVYSQMNRLKSQNEDLQNE